MDTRAGDIGFTRNPGSIFSRLILWATRSKGEAPSMVNHSPSSAVEYYLTLTSPTRAGGRLMKTNQMSFYSRTLSPDRITPAA